MPRPVPPVTADEFSGEERKLYEQITQISMHGIPIEKFRLNAWMGSLLYWPEYTKNRMELSRLLLTIPERPGSYSHADREWADMVLSTHLNTNVVMRTHLADAIGAGVRADAIAAIRSGNEDELTTNEKLLADFCRQIVDGKVTDQSFEAVEEYMGTRATVEYVIFVTCLDATMRQMQAFGSDAPTDEEVDTWVREYQDGTRGAPDDWRSRALNAEPAAA